eukprot:jgi/Ulvmu1/4683/UM002_0414.1
MPEISVVDALHGSRVQAINERPPLGALNLNVQPTTYQNAASCPSKDAADLPKSQSLLSSPYAKVFSIASGHIQLLKRKHTNSDGPGHQRNTEERGMAAELPRAWHRLMASARVLQYVQAACRASDQVQLAAPAAPPTLRLAPRLADPFVQQPKVQHASRSGV